MQRLRSSDPGHFSSHSVMSGYGLCVVRFLASAILFPIFGLGDGELSRFWSGYDNNSKRIVLTSFYILNGEFLKIDETVTDFVPLKLDFLRQDS